MRRSYYDHLIREESNSDVAALLINQAKLMNLFLIEAVDQFDYQAWLIIWNIV